jgi:hypothetical protein
VPAVGVRHTQVHYNPLTAADEKIALPVVHVNNKPQYLVFSLHLWHPIRKQRQLPVESSQASGMVRSWAAKNAANAVLAWSAAHFGVIDKRSAGGGRRQGAGMVQFCHESVRVVEKPA